MGAGRVISRPIRSTAAKLQNTVLSGKTAGAMDHSPTVLASCARRSSVGIPIGFATGRSVMCPCPVGGQQVAQQEG